MPKNQVLFECNMQMNEHDVKNYLEQIYDVPVHHVRLTLHKGEQRFHATGMHYVPRNDNISTLMKCLIGARLPVHEQNVIFFSRSNYGLRPPSRLQISLRDSSQRRDLRIPPSGQREGRRRNRPNSERRRNA